jgi:hypothetical protein
MRKYWLVLVFAVVVVVIAFAADPQDVAADALAKAFTSTRLAAHLPPLGRMGRNTFGDKVCQHDFRMPSGNIDLVRYETSDPSQLPEAAQKLAIRPDDGYRKVVRYGIGVCVLATSAGGSPRFSVLIATYESRWESFVRIFWERIESSGENRRLLTCTFKALVCRDEFDGQPMRHELMKPMP